MKFLRGIVNYEEGYYRESNCSGIYQTVMHGRICYKVMFTKKSPRKTTYITCGTYDNLEAALRVRDLYYYIFNVGDPRSKVKPFRSEMYYHRLAHRYYSGNISDMMVAMMKRYNLIPRRKSSKSVDVRSLL